jgi:hypothetical protein
MRDRLNHVGSLFKRLAHSEVDIICTEQGKGATEDTISNSKNMCL